MRALIPPRLACAGLRPTRRRGAAAPAAAAQPLLERRRSSCPPPSLSLPLARPQSAQHRAQRRQLGACFASASPGGLPSAASSLALPAALVGALVLGFLVPAPGVAAEAAGAVEWATALVFILTGASLRLQDVVAAFSAKRAALFGTLSSLVAGALLARPLLAAGPALLPGLAPPFLAGLALLCCMPTTLSTGVILTRAANANSALTLLLVLSTNILGVLTIPAALAYVFGAAAGAALDPAAILVGLARTILAPLVAGAALRASLPGCAAFADAQRPRSRLLQQACLVATPWMKISCHAPQLASVAPYSLAVMAAACAALHLLLILGNAAACALLRLGGAGPDAARTRRAVVLATSEKTLPVSVAVLAQLGGALGEPGLVLLPCVTFHLLQILLDSALVALWLQRDAAQGRALNAA